MTEGIMTDAEIEEMFGEGTNIAEAQAAVNTKLANAFQESMMSGIYCALFGLEKYREGGANDAQIVEAVADQLADLRQAFPAELIADWDSHFGKAWDDANKDDDEE